MNNQQISAYLYMLAGLFLIVFFGGKLIIQLLGILVGLLLIRHGMMLNSVPPAFYTFFKSFDHSRYR